MTQRILYVEDNPNNMLLVQRIVEADGYTLLQAKDGESGWETAVTERPDLILMDLHLPGSMTGFDLTRKIKQNTDLRHIPIIALTAFGNAEAEQSCLDAGCADFLTKPADIRQIRATLRQHLPQPVVTTEQDTAVTYAYI